MTLATGLSPKVSSAGMVKILLGVVGTGMLPPKRAVNPYTPPNERDSSSGVLLFEEEGVSLKGIVRSLAVETAGEGFLPHGWTVVERDRPGNFRIGFVFSSEIDLEEEPEGFHEGAERYFDGYYWNVRVWRNAGDRGGHFVVDASMPRSVSRYTGDYSILTIKDDEFSLRAGPPVRRGRRG